MLVELLAPLALALPSAPLAGSLQARPGDELARLLPPGRAVLLFHDLGSLHGEEQKSNWVAFGTDPRTAEILSEASPTGGAELEEMKFLVPALASLSSGALSISETGQTLGLFEIEQAAGEALLEGLARQGEAEWSEMDGIAEGKVLILSSPEEVRLFHATQGKVFLSRGPLKEASAQLVALEEHVRAGAGEPGWWEAFEGRLPGAQFEVMAQLPSDFYEGSQVESIGPFYGAFELGAGNASELVMSLDLDGPEYMQTLQSCMADPDLELLDLTVESDLSATLFSLDFPNLIEFILSMLEDILPNAVESYQGGLAGAGAMLGMDVEEDLIGNLTGQVLLLQPSFSIADVSSMEGQTGIVLAMGLKDHQPFIDLIELAMDMGGGEDVGIEFLDHDHAEVWVADAAMMGAPLPGEIALAISKEFLVFGTRERVELFLAHAQGADRETSIGRDLLGDLEERLTGPAVSVFSMDRAIDMARTAPVDFLESALDDGTRDAAVQARAVHRLAEVASEYLGGLLVNGFQIEGDRLRTFWRTR